MRVGETLSARENHWFDPNLTPQFFGVSMSGIFVISFETSGETYYYKPSYGCTRHLNQAFLYASKKRVNEALKAIKDDLKSISRKGKSPLFDFKEHTDVPNEFNELIINVETIRFESKEVGLVIL